MDRPAPGVDLLFPNSNRRIAENVQLVASVRKVEQSRLDGSTQNGTLFVPNSV